MPQEMSSYVVPFLESHVFGLSVRIARGFVLFSR